MEETKEMDSKKEIENSKKYSLKDAASVNGTVGFGDNYISAYAVSLNASATQIGFLTSIPNLIAPLAQLVTAKLMEKSSRKEIYSKSILIQSLMWLPIIAISFLFLKSFAGAAILLVIFYTVYALFGNLASPAWISWIGDLVHAKESGKFFGLRNKIGGIAALASMILGGIILDLFKKQAEATSKLYLVYIGFVVIFSLAMIFRLISRHFVLKQHEPHFRMEKEQYFSFFSFIKRIPKSNYGKFSLFVALIVLTTNIAGPYYAIYMLKDLHYSYIQFMAISVSATLAAFFFISKWGKFADNYGNIKMIKITSLMIPLVCFMWPIAIYIIPAEYKFAFIILANFISGYAWAGFNLAAGNFVFEAATPQRRGICSAYSSIMNGLGVVIGATIGSILISIVKIDFINVIMFVSLVSGVARYLVYGTLFRTIKEIREDVGKPHWRTIPIASELYNTRNFIKRNLFLKLKNHKKVKISSSIPTIEEKQL